jgi:hypothetical protein
LCEFHPLDVGLAIRLWIRAKDHGCGLLDDGAADWRLADVLGFLRAHDQQPILFEPSSTRPGDVLQLGVGQALPELIPKPDEWPASDL